MEQHVIGLMVGEGFIKTIDDIVFGDGNAFEKRYGQLIAGAKCYKFETWKNPVDIKELADIKKLLKAHEESNDEKYAYKFVCVGEEGGVDELANPAGLEAFIDLRPRTSVEFPIIFERYEDPSKYLDEVTKRYYEIDEEVAAEIMSEVLMDETVTSCGMYDELASAYIGHSDDLSFLDGLNRGISILTGCNIADLTEKAYYATEERHKGEE
jgi:hypothetical protein